MLFDFDGTIADTEDLVFEATNALAQEFGFEPIRPDEYPAIRAMGARERIVSRLGIPLWNILKVRRLERRAREEYTKRAHEIRVIDGIADVVAGLRERGLRVAILSSNDAVVVRETVERAGLSFDFYDTGSRALGKARALRKAMGSHSVPPGEVIYVGDELRDVEACRSADVRMVGVAWGLTDAAALRAGGIEVASTPEELQSLLDAAVVGRLGPVDQGVGRAHVTSGRPPQR